MWGVGKSIADIVVMLLKKNALDKTRVRSDVSTSDVVKSNLKANHDLAYFQQAEIIENLEKL